MGSPEEDLGEIAGIIGRCYPHHEEALRTLLGRGKMNNDRWNMASAILSSLSSVPGASLSSREHESRSLGMMAVKLTQAMSKATFGGPGADRARDFAESYAREILGVSIERQDP